LQCRSENYNAGKLQLSAPPTSLTDDAGADMNLTKFKACLHVQMMPEPEPTVVGAAAVFARKPGLLHLRNHLF